LKQRFWPEGKVPDWAEATANFLHCSTGSIHITEAGLREIIRQLKEALKGTEEALQEAIHNIDLEGG
jgi:hypothetical protein